MSGRGRGRGALARWEASKTSGETRIGSSSTVFPRSTRENWEVEIKQEPDDNSRSETHIRVTHIIDVEHFWAQTGKLDLQFTYIYNGVTKTQHPRTKNVF